MSIRRNLHTIKCNYIWKSYSKMEHEAYRTWYSMAYMQPMLLTTCINYANINNSMLSMCGHISAGFYRCDILILEGKHNGFRHTVSSA